ncbi:cysteine hydrolase [Leucobacter insecticola]|uniref:Cysteine hydrolase n=1 Tax=Leucobacter insecticola TaxID=2714934 RepID=A0A6G8FK87_9MICO|nr:isochorismatase family cysteine hydrolase [Leucobacter insecticola]QIM16787.1 cysteine hydrolase [Leucobacter insecticola]
MNPTPETALLLVDVINSFYEQDQTNYYPEVEKTLPALASLLDTARARDALVVHAVERHYRGLADFEFAKLPRHHQAGEHDVNFFPGFEPAERVREIVIPKRRYSAFYATDLELLLREQSITRVIVAGVKTNVCIRATVQDAFAGGFEVVVPREATNSNRPHLAEATLEDIERYFGHVVSLHEAEALL